MPNATLRPLLLGLSLTLGLPFATLAQPGQPGHHGRPVLTPTATAYVQTQVMPVLRQQRRLLEAQLAPADQATLANCRTQLAEVRAGLNVLHTLLRATPGASSHSALSDEQWQQLGALQQQEWDIMQKVRALAKQYEPALRQQWEQLEPHRERWAHDLLEPRPAAATQPAKQPTGYHFAWHYAGPLGGILRPVSFLLLEPAAAPELAGTSLYPNPATAASQLQYEVKQAGPVRAHLLDAQGQPLRELFAEPARQPGTYTQPLDFGSLAPGTYFYRLTTSTGTQTQRFVKE